MYMTDFTALLQTPVFKGLSAAEINELLSGIHYRRRKVKAGTIIAFSGDQVNSLIIVVSGVVKGEMTDYAGKVVKIEDIPAPGALAAAFIFGRNNRFPVNVIAATDAGLFIISKDGLLKILKENERVLANFLDMVSNRSQFLSEKIRFLNFKTIKGKLAQYILERAGDKNNFVRMELTHNELAVFFGVARPSVSRAIKELEDEGSLEVKGKDINILDRNKLLWITGD
jgi:CRP-like cAMP-binding protein